MSIEARAHDLFAVIAEHTTGTPLEVFCAVVCNDCGRIARAPSLLELVRSGDLNDWLIGDEFGDADYCPDCKGGHDE